MGQALENPKAAGEAGKGVTRKLARHAATLRYEMLPPAFVDMIRQCVIDTLGVTIGASTLAPEARILADYVKEQGGKAEATLLGFGGKVHAAGAALVNGSLGHMLDYDDLGESGHPSIVTIPVALAVAEKLGGAGSAPSAVIRPRISGAWMIWPISRLSAATMAGGTPAGA